MPKVCVRLFQLLQQNKVDELYQTYHPNGSTMRLDPANGHLEVIRDITHRSFSHPDQVC